MGYSLNLKFAPPFSSLPSLSNSQCFANSCPKFIFLNRPGIKLKSWRYHGSCLGWFEIPEYLKLRKVHHFLEVTVVSFRFPDSFLLPWRKGMSGGHQSSSPGHCCCKFERFSLLIAYLFWTRGTASNSFSFLARLTGFLTRMTLELEAIFEG